MRRAAVLLFAVLAVLLVAAALRRAAVLLFAVLAVLLVAAVRSPAAGAEPGQTFVVGGAPIPIETVPHQVFLRVGDNLGCGGSVLDPTHVLTAAHCVVAPRQTAPRPASSITVLAGFTDVTTWGGGTPPAGTQVAAVASVRVHPLYVEPTKADDVAVLTLARALDLSGPRTRAVTLAPVGSGPAPGAALRFSGYGAQVEGRVPDGRLYGATLLAIGDERCRPNIAVNASASVQCVAAGSQAACFGDSGGPLTAGGVQVGVASYAPQAGCARGPSGFADVTAPEVRAFVDGAATLPVAPRQGDPALIRTVIPPVQGSPIRCAPGTWSGAPALAYTFVDDGTGRVLRHGASATFVPTAAHLGMPVACVVSASNAGGTSWARTGTTAAIRRDELPPLGALRSVRCRKRRCSVRLVAADPNSQGPLRVRVTAERRERGRCGKRRRCTGTRVRSFAVERVGETRYRATASRVRRGRTTIRVRLTDAAGNRRRPDLVRTIRVR